MRIEDFDYELPAGRIAQQAVEPRDAARLLVLDRASGATAHRRVRDLPELLGPGDLLVVNDTRVVPARLFGRKPTGGRVELLFLERRGGSGGQETWLALVGASRMPAPGVPLALPGGRTARLLAPPDDEGHAEVAVDGDVRGLLAAHGLPPLPPYIRRDEDDPRLARDRERYQTVFAERPGAVAAPTAGLHFTPELLARLAARGVRVARATLHVGEGTFRAPRESRLDRIRLHPERFELPAATAGAISETRAAGGRVVAVGTTVVRTLESCPPDAGRNAPQPGAGETSLFIRPGHRFRWVDAMLTNFHLPRSTLLVLVAAFAGREPVLAAYREAVREGYRFYSYGDAMLIL
ncbi:MAG: tRNA preQ1(34) S-adenosylmethionine ribosyltransferase-isomerase QueA [Acidobacteria bacterium]|nr:MAG: tRNA preQ1(34) S-adenosylmethionine ribosyltransferase-isomerase QueA [Acidobacteriota bacterium]